MGGVAISTHRIVTVTIDFDGSDTLEHENFSQVEDRCFSTRWNSPQTRAKQAKAATIAESPLAGLNIVSETK